MITQGIDAGTGETVGLDAAGTKARSAQADAPKSLNSPTTTQGEALEALKEWLHKDTPSYPMGPIALRSAIIAALQPNIDHAVGGVREAAAEIVNEAARTWTWEAGEEEGHAYRNKACAERRAQWDDDDCPHDGSCVECARDMHEHFETPASKEHRRELRNLAAKIRALPGHAIVQECPGEYSPCEHSSEIVNELGNTIRFRLFAQAGKTRDGDDGGVPKVVVHAFGPTSKAIHAWTANEARELHRLLSLAFPSLSAPQQPVKLDAVREARAKQLYDFQPHIHSKQPEGLKAGEWLTATWEQLSEEVREGYRSLIDKLALATPPLDNTGLDAVREALKCAVGHLEHLSQWIGGKQMSGKIAGYSFESLGEDMPNIYAALSSSPQPVSPTAFERAPKHKYWGAGEQGCPSDIKAGNGELHTHRCKICELDNPRDPICHADAHFAALATPSTDTGLDPATKGL